MRTHVDLFSGIGGFSLAAERAGYTTVLFVEKDDYCQKVLRKHWPNVPIIGDIRDVTEESLAHTEGWTGRHDGADFGAAHREVNAPDDAGVCRGTSVVAADSFPPIDLLTGGFPCQPFSVAGKRGGEADDRYLWPQMLRVIRLLQPTWIIAENVSGLLTIDDGMVFERVLSDLEGEGYEVQPFVIPACAVNAPHRRDRVWIVAHRDGGRCEGQHLHVQPRGPRQAHTETAGGCEDVPDAEGVRCVQGDADTGGDRARTETAQERSGLVDGCAVVADAERPGLEGADTTGHPCTGGRPTEPGQLEREADWWSVEPRMGESPDGLPAGLVRCWGDGWENGVPRVATGVKDRVNKLRCLGNAIVPQVAYEIIRAMAPEEGRWTTYC